jgi:hypothetical protein
MLVIAVLRKGRQEDREFEASLGYKVRICLKKPKTKTEKQRNQS